MAPLSTNAAVAHFLHPAHKLTELNDDTPYLCDGCKIVGNGTRFSCVPCQFDLHAYCAKCPHVLTSPTNHPHTMNLLVYKPKPYQTEPCQICQEPIQGLVYECKSCNFLVHPLCVSSNSGLDQVRSAFPSSGSTTQRGLTTPTTQTHSGSTTQGIGVAVGVGLGTNYIYDKVKDEAPKVDGEGDGDFLEGVFSILGSIFSSSSK